MVEAGSNVVFRWTIDDKQSLTFHNVVFNVIYQSAAIFKLSVGRGQADEVLGSWVIWVLIFAFCCVSFYFAPEDTAMTVSECGETEQGFEVLAVVCEPYAH